jgi:hypothetical protein
MIIKSLNWQSKMEDKKKNVIIEKDIENQSSNHTQKQMKTFCTVEISFKKIPYTVKTGVSFRHLRHRNSALASVASTLSV